MVNEVQFPINKDFIEIKNNQIIIVWINNMYAHTFGHIKNKNIEMKNS